jgi:hypothetical protein
VLFITCTYPVANGVLLKSVLRETAHMGFEQSINSVYRSGGSPGCGPYSLASVTDIEVI